MMIFLSTFTMHSNTYSLAIRYLRRALNSVMAAKDIRSRHHREHITADHDGRAEPSGSRFDRRACQGGEPYHSGQLPWQVHATIEGR